MYKNYNGEIMRPPELRGPGCQCLPFKFSEMGDTHVHFIRPMAPASTRRSESSELQNLRRNAAEGLPQKVHSVHGLTSWHVWHAPSIIHVTDEWHQRSQVCIRVED